MDLPSLDRATGRDLIDGSYCVGYLNGFTGSVNAPICTQNASMADVVRVYVTFMGQNPQLLLQDRRMGLQRALQDAYPCSILKTSEPENPRRRPRT